MFPNWQGNVESLANIHTRCWKSLLKDCGLPSYTLHALRHFHASHLIDCGSNLKEVQVEMGHSSVQVTLDLYTHLLPDGDHLRKTRAEQMLPS